MSGFKERKSKLLKYDSVSSSGIFLTGRLTVSRQPGFQARLWHTNRATFIIISLEKPCCTLSDAEMAQDAEHEQTLQERSDMLLAEQSALQKRLKQLQQEIELEEDAARQLAAGNGHSVAVSGSLPPWNPQSSSCPSWMR